MERLSWKYMAGLVDGEGCIDMAFNVDKRDGTFTCRPRLRIVLAGDSGKNLLEMVRGNFGGHEVKMRHRNKINPNWQDAYVWEIYGKNARAFLQNIVNHLVIKKEQARFAIWWVDHMLGKHVPAETRKSAVDELKAMKRDPQRLSERAELAFMPWMNSSKSWCKRDEGSCVVCGVSGLNTNSMGRCYKCRSVESDATVQSALVENVA